MIFYFCPLQDQYFSNKKTRKQKKCKTSLEHNRAQKKALLFSGWGVGSGGEGKNTLLKKKKAKCFHRCQSRKVTATGPITANVQMKTRRPWSQPGPRVLCSQGRVEQPAGPARPHQNTREASLVWRAEQSRALIQYTCSHTQ